MKKFITLLLFVPCLSLAKDKENLEFQCALKNGAVVTVHSTKPKKAHYIYRYTKNGKVELEIKQSNKMMDEKRLFGSYDGFSGEVRKMYFLHGKYSYKVYSGYYPDSTKRNGVVYFDGVDVSNIKKNAHILYELECVKVKQHLLDIDL